MLHSFFRVFHFAFQNFWRNFWLSMVTIFIIMLAFLSVNVFLLGNLFLDTSLAAIEERVNITIYFKQNAAEKDILALKDDLSKSGLVTESEYITRDAALERLKERYDREGNPLIKESLAELESNPLAASLTLRARSIEDYPALNRLIDASQYANIIEKKDVKDRDILIAKINRLKENVQAAGLAVNGVFAIIAVLIIFNTIRVTIYSRRREIGIMKLVGATNSFIRWPLLIEGVLYSVCAIGLTILIFFPILSFIQPFASTFFAGQGLDVLGYFNDNFIRIFGYQLMAAVVLSMLSTTLAMGRYLRV